MSFPSVVFLLFLPMFLMLIDELYLNTIFLLRLSFYLSIAVNLDNTVGAVGFVPAFARTFYPVTLVR